jgi:hypothetical protein
MPTFELAEQLIDTRRGERVALIAVPQRQIPVGLRRLEELASQTKMSELDALLLDQVRGWPKKPSALIMSAKGPHGDWHFEEGMTDQQESDLGYHLTRTQLPLYFGLLEAGISLCYFTAYGARELEACQTGTARLLAEFERDRPMYHGDEGARKDAGLRLVRDLIAFSSQEYPELFEGELPDRLPLCETRADQIREQLAALSE